MQVTSVLPPQSTNRKGLPKAHRIAPITYYISIFIDILLLATFFATISSGAFVFEDITVSKTCTELEHIVQGHAELYGNRLLSVRNAPPWIDGVVIGIVFIAVFMLVNIRTILHDQFFWGISV